MGARLRALPVRDPFSHSMPGASWISSEWLAQILLAAVHDQLGWSGIIVIAASVGYAGLGGRVYKALQNLRVGEALTAGLAIVAVAIVLDRVTYGWSQAERTRRGSTSVRIFGWTISRRVAGALLVVLVIGAVKLGVDDVVEVVGGEALQFRFVQLSRLVNEGALVDYTPTTSRSNSRATARSSRWRTRPTASSFRTAIRAAR